MSNINRITALIRDLESEVDTLQAMCVRQLTVLHQANDEMKELRATNKAMHDRLLANRLSTHAEARYQGRSDGFEGHSITPRQSKFMAAAMAGLILDRGARPRVNRIATGILNRINDGHYKLASIMAETLVNETKEKEDGKVVGYDPELDFTGEDE